LAEVNPQKKDRSPDAQEEYFGTRITPGTFHEWLAHISSTLGQGRRRWLSGHHNLHSLFLLQRDADVRRFYERCNDCYIDGHPVRFILRGFGVSTTSEQRFSLMDHFLDLLYHAEKKNWSIFYLGSREDVVNLGSALIRQKFPGLRIQLHHGYHADTAELIQGINEWRPDVLLVGMGMPLQESWIIRHLDDLDAGFVAQAGATLDYYTGAQAKPPLCLSRYGLAWLHRLANDPRRLWRRYLLEPWALLGPTLRHWYRYARFQ